MTQTMSSSFSYPVTGDLYVKDQKGSLHKIIIPQIPDTTVKMTDLSGNFTYDRSDEPEPEYIAKEGQEPNIAGGGVQYSINSGSLQTYTGDTYLSTNYITDGEVLSLPDFVISNDFTFSEETPFVFKISGFQSKYISTTNQLWYYNQSGYSHTFTISTLDDFKTYSIQSAYWNGSIRWHGFAADLVVEQVDNQNTMTLKNIRLFTDDAARKYYAWLHRTTVTEILLTNYYSNNTSDQIHIDMSFLKNKIKSLEDRLTLLEATQGD